MICERTCALLNMLSGISNTCILRYPSTIINDECKSIIARLDLTDLETEFEPLGLNGKISNLTSIISMFDNPNIERVDNILCIHDNNNVDTQFVTDNIELLENTEFKFDVFDRIVSSLSVAEFVLTKDDITKLKKAHSVYSDLDDIIIAGEEDVKISLGALAKFNRSDNKFSITKDVTPSKNFDCAISFDSLQRIPPVDYTVNIKFSERSNSYAIVLENKEMHLQIILSVLVR